MDETQISEAGHVRDLAAYRRFTERIADRWPAFASRRRDRLRQGLFDAPAEKVAENILEDLFTDVLDWDLGDVNLQVGRADIILSELGFKRLVLEVKRPGSLLWHRRSVQAALDQARRYAAEQKVGSVAVSDGQMLYAADVVYGGLRDRLLVDLGGHEAPTDLWWVSVHGIYRRGPELVRSLPEEPAKPDGVDEPAAGGTELLHHKYHLPIWCFAYVAIASDPATWKLPYLRVDGEPDLNRLPKAIQAILSNYRGAKVTIPREAVGDVLVRLGTTAASLGKMPCQSEPSAEVYRDAHAALDQLGRLSDVGCCGTC